jgi:hypothetical protein
VVANKRFVKIFTPLLCSSRGVFANLRMTFKLLLLNSDRTTIMGDFFLPSTNNVFNFWIWTILQRSTLGYCNVNTFVKRRSGIYRAEKRQPLKWRRFDEISKDTISKIKYTALFQNWMKPSLKSSSVIYDYVKVE